MSASMRPVGDEWWVEHGGELVHRTAFKAEAAYHLDLWLERDGKKPKGPLKPPPRTKKKRAPLKRRAQCDDVLSSSMTESQQQETPVAVKLSNPEDDDPAAEAPASEAETAPATTPSIGSRVALSLRSSPGLDDDEVRYLAKKKIGALGLRELREVLGAMIDEAPILHPEDAAP